LHFVLILIYANPFPSGTKHKLDYYAQWYVYPYFTQNWNLFVPPPSTNYKLLVSYENNGKQSIDIFNEILIKHQTNRFAGNSALLLAFSNSIHYFEKNTRLQNSLNGPVKNDLYFQILEQSAKNYIQSTRNIKIDELKLSLCVEDLPTKKMKVYYNE
jgi:hypothetical protein